MRVLVLSFLSIISFLSIGQTGAGGVGNSSNNVFWLDANQLSYLNNENVQFFTDISGNNNDFKQLVSSKQPIYKTSVVNGFPVVRFDGVNDELKSNSITALETSALTIFVVYKQSGQKNAGFLGGNYASNEHKWFVYCLDNGIFRSIHYSPNPIHIDYPDDYSNFNITSTHYNSNGISLYKEGNLIGLNNVPYSQPSGHNFCVISNYPGQTGHNWKIDGDIAEIIVYNNSLTDLERIIIENYLGAKYNKVIAQDLYSYQTGHKYGVIGIGNDGVTSHTTSTGYGELTIDNPTALSSNEYMFIGHDGVDLSVIVNGDMPAPVSTHSRLSRTWRVDETGNLGNVTLKFDISGPAGFADASTYNLLVDTDGDGDFSNSTVVSGTLNGSSMEFTLDLISGSVFTLSGVPIIPVAIHSVQSGPWNVTTTWDCGCVPTNTDTVYIESTHTVNVDNNAYVFDLTIKNGGILEMSQDFLLSIKENLTINGNVNLTDGELGFTGNGAQIISGNGNSHSLNKVLIDNLGTSNITFTNGEYILNNILTPNNGDVVIDNAGNGTLIINSTSSTTTGRIGIMTSTSSISGNVSVRRFLPAGVAGERTLSSPVIGANLSEWDATIAISGVGFPDGCAYGSNGCYYSCKRFIGGELSSNYIDVTNPNEPLINGIGYELFLGDDLNTWSGAIITSTGQIRDYTDYSLHYPIVKHRWNIIGNPYASPILFSQMPNAQMYPYFYIFDAASGSYQWYDKTTNTSSIPELAEGKIAIGQGFWIKAGGVPGVYFSQGIKATTGTFIKRLDNTDNLAINLTLTQEGTTYKNMASIDFSTESYDSYDSLDVDFFTNDRQKASSILIKVEDELLAKTYLSKDGRNKRINISLKILNDGYYAIDASNVENNLLYKYVTLIDKETNQKIDLRKYPHYSFYAEQGEFDRFTVILSNDRIVGHDISSAIENVDDEIVLSQIGNAINVQSKEVVKGKADLTIYNLLGQELIFSTTFEIQKGDNLVIVPEELSGIYIVVVKTANGITTKKMMF